MCNPYTCECQNMCIETEYQISEECDDGNSASGDGCSNICQMEYCGDAVVDADGVDNVP